MVVREIQKFKTRLPLLVGAIVFILLMFCTSAYGATEGDYTYEEITGGVVITGYSGPGGDLVIPETLGGLPVLEIGDANSAEGGVFTNKALISIVLPNSLIHIGDYAFAMNQLTSVVIPNSVSIIGESAFQWNQLTSVTIGNNVKSIGEWAFFEQKITDLVIPDSVTTISNYAFGWNQLNYLTIGNGVTSIGDYAFACNKLTGLTIPGNVNSIGNFAFESNGLTNLVIEYGVESIGYKAFSTNSIISVIIPDSVTSTGGGVFYQNKLTSLTIGNGLTTIGGSDFQNNQLTNLVIPNNVKTIGSSAFYNNQLTSIEIPDSVTTIQIQAFGDNQLTSVLIPESLTSIGEYAFAGNKITSITIPKSITAIETGAFASNQLTSIVIPDSVNFIGNQAFRNNQLTSVTIHRNTISLGSNIFYLNPSNLILYGVAGSKVEAYAANNGHQFMAIPATVYTVTITEAVNGSTSGAGSYEEGDTVTLNAVPDPDYNFDGWYEGETKVSSLPGYTFTATRDITLTPVFVAMQQGYLEVTTVGSGTVTLNGNAVPLSANYKLLHFRGTPITLTAAADSGYTFAYWEDVKSASIASTDTVYESIMGSEINVKAVFIPTPTEASTYFNVIFKDKSGKILQSTNVEKNASADPPASPSIAGYDFTGWDVDYTNVTDNIITGALYTRAATKYSVTVTGGTLSTGGTSGEYQFDWPVTVVADSAPDGQKFSHWTMNDVKVSTKSTFSFFMPQKATTLSAVFADEEAVLDNSPFITLSPDVIVDYTNKIIMFTAIRNIPAEYTLVESGVLLLESDTALSEDLTVDTASVIRGKISNDSTDQFYIRKTNVSEGSTWYGRAYMIFEDANGNMITVYSGNTENATMN